MSTDKYQFLGTPAPWVLSGKQEDAIIAPHVDSNTSEYYGGFLICESVTKPNRHLIAASTNLLTASVNALDLVERLYRVNELDYDDYIIHSGELKAAIHKALNIID